ANNYTLTLPAATGTVLLSSAIDDTKGNGDTTFVYSADKTFDELALKISTSDIGTTVPGISGTWTDEQMLCAENTDGSNKAKTCGAKTTYTEPATNL
ncbi:hypothetical protein P6O75_14885, partial [Clostridium perfringens]|nr:hypothetical protein [Clostridium perfringens]